MYDTVSHVTSGGNGNWTLPELSLAKAKMLVPSIVYLSVLMVTGVLGNLLVMVVYYFRFGPSTHRCFILVLASYDFAACAVGAPLCVIESFYAYTFTAAVPCKLFRFILYYTCLASSLTLVLIAFERFRKICRPLKRQLTVTMAKRAIVVVAGVLSSLSAMPSLIMFGNATIPTGVGDINGTKCFISDGYKDTVWPEVFNFYLLGLAFLATACMASCYIAIARQVARTGRARVVRRARADPRTEQGTETQAELSMEGDSEIQTRELTNELKYINDTVTPQEAAAGGNINNGTNKCHRKSWASKVMWRLSSKSGQKTLRITKMLTLVTAAFVASYLPHLSLMLWSMITADPGPLARDNLYQVVFYSFLLNNIVNPVIYASMDVKFRTECKYLLCVSLWRRRLTL